MLTLAQPGRTDRALFGIDSSRESVHSNPMPCFIALFAYFFPRLILVLIWLFSGYLGRAYHTVIWPLLGFIFMPLTTLAYAFAINTNGSVTGMYAFLVIVAALLDLGTHGAGPAARRRRAS